ncbi:MAG: PP2C family protein-serine/threonine phosphatase [Candidatus Acidiferrales bacterium]
MAKRAKQVTTENARHAGGSVHGIVAALTDMGRSRKNNEDNILLFDLRQRVALTPGAETTHTFAPPGLLVGVADGMGGHNSGQVASQLCVDNLPGALLQLLPAADAPAEEYAAALKHAVEVTNQAILQAAKKSNELEGMGTTLTAVWLLGEAAIVAQVGDSRAYHLRAGNFTQLTRDQTLLNSVGEAEREALVNTPFENMLLQAVGAMERLDVPVETTPLESGDSLLLCSDGLYRVVTPEEMAEVLKLTDTLPAKAKTLIDMANAGGGPDNVTVVLCQIIPESKEGAG